MGTARQRRTQENEVNPASIKAVAFDCDGVLFDSSQANAAYYNHILQRFALPELTAEQFAFSHMHTVDESLAFLIEDPQVLDAVQAYRRQLSYLPFIRHMVIEPHLRSLLDRLQPAYKTAIATNRTDTMGRVLEEHGLQGRFDLVVTASHVRYPKPHPEQLLRVLAHFAIRPSQLIYIGDSMLDALAARSARVPFVAYGNPDLEADAHIESLQQLPDLIGIE